MNLEPGKHRLEKLASLMREDIERIEKEIGAIEQSVFSL